MIATCISVGSYIIEHSSKKSSPHADQLSFPLALKALREVQAELGWKLRRDSPVPGLDDVLEEIDRSARALMFGVASDGLPALNLRDRAAAAAGAGRPGSG